MQIPSVRLAKKKRWQVLVVAKEVLDKIQNMADSVEFKDLSDKHTIFETARKYKDRWGLDGVFTAGTDFSTTVAWVAEKLNLPGIPYRVALAATDKSRMRSVFRESGIHGPDYYTANRSTEWAMFARRLSFPLVVKPVDNMGARGVRRVNNEEELIEAASEAIQHSRAGKAIVEDYLEGPELSLDAIVYHGKVTVCGVADRHICFPPYFVEMGHTIPSNLKKESIEQAVHLFSRGILALGIENGAAKGDIKLTPEGPVVGEIAARLSGGYMSGWTFPLSSGIEVTEAALNIAVGLPPGDLTQRCFMHSAERAFISIPGRVGEIHGVQDAREVDGVQELFLRAGKGDRVVFPINNLGKCGNIISRADSRELAIDSAERAVRKIFLRLVPNNDATNRFLTAKEAYKSLPAAFTLSRSENLAALKSFAPYTGSIKKIQEGARGISILSLPNLSGEIVCDWHGNRIQEALQRVLAFTGVKLRDRPSEQHFNLGELFWNVFLKGGIQGGIYILDSLDALRDSPEQRKGILAELI